MDAILSLFLSSPYQAECLAAHCAVAILQAVVAGAMMMRQLTKEVNIPHFSEPFNADEEEIDSPDRIKVGQ
jgi:hypothetical protein